MNAPEMHDSRNVHGGPANPVTNFERKLPMRFALSVAAFGAALVLSAPAAAHTHLVRSTPTANATVAAPRTMALTFNEKLAPAFSKAQVVMTGHDMSVPVKVKFSADGKTMTLTPQGAFAKGAYTIKWIAAGADGHRMEGAVPFTVK